ncbi:MAG: tryptophan synthase subunit alpha [Cyclobacteriaceae bacterium]|nr:tryptophan synthase subunit alpha [Cyclobacteriaceae bacterium]
MNRINSLFENKKNEILSIYYTAGYPNLNDTLSIAQSLEQSGADIIEIGMPFSDPVADGQTIQESSKKALENGMTIQLLFEQLKTFRTSVNIPVILMGYINPIMQYGIEAFCKSCHEVGVDGVIIPDLPLSVYQKEYAAMFDEYNLKNIFLITPQTSDDRIRKIDQLSNSFIYMVSSSSTTGEKQGVSTTQEKYFQRIITMKLNNPKLIGFGISNHDTFMKACQYSNGAIIGSAFIKMLANSTDLENDIQEFVMNIKQTALN